MIGPNDIESSSKLLKQTPVENLLYACSFIKKSLQLSYFPVIFVKFFRTPVAPKVFSQQLFFFWIVLTQLIYFYSKSAIETLEKNVKCVQSWQWTQQNDVIDVVLVLLLSGLDMFHMFFQCFYCWIWTGKS